MNWLLPLCLALGSCYAPDFSETRYRCDGQNPTCPSGLRCIRGVCADPEEGKGCLSKQGFRVGQEVFACPGLFARGKAASLCAPGYGICPDGRALSGTCGGGFFASSAVARRTSTQEVKTSTCGGAKEGETVLLVGCGTLPSVSTELLNPCGGLSSAVDCATSTRLVCGTGIDDAANQEEPGSGVLCCKM